MHSDITGSRRERKTKVPGVPVGGRGFSANNRPIAASVSGAGRRFHAHQIGHHHQPLRISVRGSSAGASTVSQSDTTGATGSAAGGATSAQIIIGEEASASSQGEAATRATVGAESSGSVNVQAGNVGLRLKKLVNGRTGSLGLELEGQTEAELKK